MTGLTVPGECPCLSRFRIDDLHLVVVSIRHVDLAIVPRHAERMLEPYFVALPVDISEREEPRMREVGGSDYRFDQPFPIERHGTNGTPFRVRNE